MTAFGSDIWETAIIGAGPAGGALAAYLAAIGRKVILIDKKIFPREKICGDVIGADGLAILKELGLLEKVRLAGHELRNTSIYRKIKVPFPGADYYPIVQHEKKTAVENTAVILKRSLLDSILAEKAVANGAVFITGKVMGLDFSQEDIASIRIAGSDIPISARVAVIATGADITLPAKLGMITQKKPSGFAVRFYIKSNAIMDEMIFYHDPYENPSGYAWIFSMGNKMYNAGCIYMEEKINLKKAMDNFFSEFEPAVDLLKNGHIVSRLSGYRLRTGLTGSTIIGQGPVIAIGETIGTTGQQLGDGIGPAMQSASIAAKVIHDALHSGNMDLLKQFPEMVSRSFKS
jgi:flavin-dependent dehydrogenase